MSDSGKNQEMLEQLKGADDKKKSKKQTNGDGHVLTPAEIKRQEKEGHEWYADYLPAAFQEAHELIDRAIARKGFTVSRQS